MAMNETYTSVFCDVTITKQTKDGETITTKSATLRSGDDLYVSQVMAFFSDLKIIGKLLHTAANKGYDIRLYFGRYKHENGFLLNERGAEFIGSGFDVAENGGMYLSDKNGNGEADFWLDRGMFANLADALRQFADDGYFWTETKRPC